ncbi:MAG TPA: amidohydrolase family protein [Streptosporangiaceae bacterium]|nr:amidohydrolase family protein [Streptosporangiaceae bacterium]
MSISAEEALEYCAKSGGRLRLGLQAKTVTRITAFTGLLRDLAGRGEVALVRVIPSALECPINDPRLYHVYGTCEELGLPVIVNVGIFGPRRPSKYQDPMLLDEVLLDFPDLKVIGGHMGHPRERLLIRLMMKYENLYLMTSAFRPRYFDPELVQFMDSSRGRDKVLFGSDWPIMRLSQVVPEARALPLKPENLAAFLGDSLAALLGWP